MGAHTGEDDGRKRLGKNGERPGISGSGWGGAESDGRTGEMKKTS
jgi:hypothetical protein